MQVYKIILSALSGLIFIILLKQVKSEYSFASSAVLCVMLTTVALGFLVPVLEYIKSLENTISSGGFIEIMFRCTGVGLLCAFAGEICRDCGESSLGGRIELIGKCVMLSYCLPLLKTVLDYAEKIVD